MAKGRRYTKRRPTEEEGAAVSRRTLQQMGDLASVLGGVLGDQIPELIYQMRVQAEALEMNLWVTAYMLAKHTGVDAEDLIEEIAQLQQEFLATQAISRFLEVMGAEDPEPM